MDGWMIIKGREWRGRTYEMLALCEDWTLPEIYSQWERNGLFPVFWPGLSGQGLESVHMRHSLQEKGGEEVEETGLFQIYTPVGKMSVCDLAGRPRDPVGRKTCPPRW